MRKNISSASCHGGDWTVPARWAPRGYVRRRDSYYPNSADKRLQTIQNNTSGGTLLSQFDYFYDADGEITQLNKQLGAGTQNSYVWGGYSGVMNDAADQLKWFGESQGGGFGNLFQFSYDNAGNHLVNLNGSFTYNEVNQIATTGYTYDENGNLTADIGRTYTWDAANRIVKIEYPAFPGWKTEFTYDGLGRRVKIVEWGQTAPVLDWTFQPTNTNYGDYSAPGSYSLASGTYTLTLQGLNPNGGNNTVLLDAVKLLKNSNNFAVNGGFETPSLPAQTYTVNPSGATWAFVGNGGISRNNSLITSGNPNAPAGIQVGVLEMNSSMSQSLTLNGTYTFTLKAAQRTANPTFQQVRVTLQSPTIVLTSTKQFVWNGEAIAEERDANNVVTRRFYPQGEQISGVSYYYTRDHLGSVRELIDSTGAVRARYDYDPYGYRTKLTGNLDASFGYTGHYYHQASGLNLALYRAYDAVTGRWISRDPLGESQGPNLYNYVINNPINLMDPDGLAPFRNRSSRTIVVGGGTGPGDGHAGPHIQIAVPPGGQVDACHPAYTPDGRGPLQDVATVDTDGDGVAQAPGNLWDLNNFWHDLDTALREQIPGNDVGDGYTAYDMPLSRGGIVLLSDFKVEKKCP